jgi:Phytanoyl-CoA dioxygenase (PhyH)
MKNARTDLSFKGYTIIPSFLDEGFTHELKESMSRSYDLCKSIQVRNGIDATTDGTVHHLIASGDKIYSDLIDRICRSDIFKFIQDYFGGNYIINSYGGVINLPLGCSYVTNMHRDIRFFSGGFPLMLNMLVMLDDLTPENGALYLLAGSHEKGDRPVVEKFFKESDRAAGKKGDILFFNSNLWHAAGINNTQQETKEITITFTKPFMKQQFDYSRSFGYDNLKKMSTEAQQIIGYFARTPSTLEEWYQKPENRFYRPGQD